MTPPVNLVIEAVAVFVAGGGLGYWLCRWKEKNLHEAHLIEEKAILQNARREAESIAREAHLSASEESLKVREENQKLFETRRSDLKTLEKRLHDREALLNHQFENLVREEKTYRENKQDYEQKVQGIVGLREELVELQRQRREQLQQLANVSEAEARATFLKEIEADTQRDAGHLARHILEDAKVHAEEKARRIVSIAIQRYAGEHTFETSTATVTLTGDEIKGRIIGREGRNIRAFESATGVTVLIDDTPNAVVLSGFDPVRREVAREAMERLILDGRIHPTRIEEVVAKVSAEMDETIVRVGEEAVMKAGLPPLHPEIVKVLGRLHFRHSFSQNILNHSVEVAHLMGLMASELGIEVASAKRAGLLHDLGKAVNHEIEGAHAIVGADIIKRYGESEAIVNGVASHHGEVPHTGLLGILVGAADAISASRPGARSETMTTYIKRVEDLERIGLSFKGVEKCYAVQAGRELRVFVTTDQLTDEESYVLARNIARKIEEELQYPGQIRITVVRETRCIEFAK